MLEKIIPMSVLKKPPLTKVCALIWSAFTHHMAGALAITAAVAFLVANTSLIAMMFDPQTGGKCRCWAGCFCCRR